ncbi:MAG: phosphonate C-P lyase system protein PhnH [Marinibacterium sp.]|nr:phosphonate C-P lyase system protein PhnH [Marinibacterium sp.]
MTGAGVFQGGFDDAPRDAAHAFRAAMRAMARPGTREDLAGAVPPAPLSVAAGCLILTLCDPDTGLYLAGDADCPVVRDWVTFHTGAQLVGAEDADFALGSWAALQPLAAYRIGTPEYPDQSATLIVELPGWPAANARLTGPGIERDIQTYLPDPAALADNGRLYPLGIDLFFTCDTAVQALPRSSRITTSGG